MNTPKKSRCAACGAAYNGCPLHRAAPALVAALETALFALQLADYDLESCVATGTNQPLRAVILTALKLAKGE